MKKLILFSLLSFLFSTVKAQTIDTAFKAHRSCKVVQFLNNPRTDFVKVHRVVITSALIDVDANTINVSYFFINTDGTQSNWSNCILTGVDYAAILNGIKNGYAIIFQYLGTKLNIQYQ